MKGIAHFASALAAATFVPHIVRMSAQGGLPLLLAGVGALLPDAIDFRLARYLEQPDVEVDLDPNVPDPQAVADQVAEAINRAVETLKPLIIQFHTLKLAADLWREYSVRFDGPAREVQVRIGPVVTTSLDPVPESALDLPVGRAPIVAATRHTYGVEIKVNAFSGPSLECRNRQGVVEVTFLPWHRRWSHSLPLAVLLGGLVALAFGPWYGLAYMLGSALHILQDQLGHMGSNLLYPFTRRRLAGFGLFHSGDALPNFFAVWLSLWLILFNLDRFSLVPSLNVWHYLLIGLALPWLLVLGLLRVRRRGTKHERSVDDAMIGEALAEAEQIEL